jgi:SMC interacting uncharacterized protein involved in chromosome segregation
MFTDPHGIVMRIHADDLVNRRGEFIGQDIVTLIPDLQLVQFLIDECMQTTKAYYEDSQNVMRLKNRYMNLLYKLRDNSEEYPVRIKELKQRISRVEKEINTLEKGYNAPPLEAFE